MEKLTKPEIIISSFAEPNVHAYISKLNDIQNAFGPEQLIVVHIDSYGGSVFGFFMLYEHLQSMENPIATYTSSKAMSAGAFLLAMAGNKGLRYASPNATILVHEIQASSIGDIKEMEQQLDSLAVINTRLLGLFAEAIGLKDAASVRELIKARSVGHNLTLTAQEAKELGIIDGVGLLRLQPEMQFNLHLKTERPENKENKGTKEKTKKAKTAKTAKATKTKR